MRQNKSIMTSAENPKTSSWHKPTSLYLLICCPIAFFFFLISWAVGGDEFAESIGGYYTLTSLLGGVAVGAALKTISGMNGKTTIS